MDNFFTGIFSTEHWPPRWICGEWTSFHGWFYILSDLSIGLAYFTIPFMLFYFIRKRKNELPFVQVFWLFILFILACGTTHFADAALFWFPAYRLSGSILFVTGIISWAAVIGLIKVMPEALQLKTNEQLENMVASRTEQLRVSNEQLQRTNSDLDDFVYSASHDLKSPINNVEGLLQLLKNTKDEEQAADIIKKMELSVSKVKTTINQISHVVKVQRAKEAPVAELSFEATLNDILEENGELVRQANPTIRTDFKLASISYPPEAFKSILYNIVINALKYRSEERRLDLVLKTYELAGHTFLEVHDNGLGIDLKRNKHKLFSIFSRFHDHVEGSGVGLFMIKRLIEKRGGYITVESTPGSGSVFKVRF